MKTHDVIVTYANPAPFDVVAGLSMTGVLFTLVAAGFLVKVLSASLDGYVERVWVRGGQITIGIAILSFLAAIWTAVARSV